MVPETDLSVSLSRQCLPKVCGRSVFGGILHSFVCLSSDKWHTCSTDRVFCLTNLRLFPYHSAACLPFTALWTGSWELSTALKYALTCSTFCQAALVGVSLGVPSMTLIASFCTLQICERGLVDASVGVSTAMLSVGQNCVII